MIDAQTYDVCVAGFGTWGAATAWALARRGLRVIAVDPFAAPHEHGSHTGRTRLARRSAHEGAGYTAITVRAFALWGELERDLGVSLIHTPGALLLDHPQGPLVGPSRQSLQDGGWAYHELQPQDVARRWAGLRVHRGEVALFEPDACTIDAPAAVAALGEMARRAGVEVLIGPRVVNWRPDTGRGDRLLVELAEGAARSHARVIRARRLVLAIGNRAPHLADTGWPLQVERQVLVTYELPEALRTLPALFAVDHRLGPRSGFYGCPEPPGAFKVALHHDGLTGAPENLPAEVSGEDLDAVARVVADRVPGLTGTIVDAKVCTYTNSADHDWILDRHPRDPNVIVATGDSGRGFRYAPAIGELVAALAVDDDDQVPGFLRAGRF